MFFSFTFSIQESLSINNSVTTVTVHWITSTYHLVARKRVWNKSCFIYMIHEIRDVILQVFFQIVCTIVQVKFPHLFPIFQNWFIFLSRITMNHNTERLKRIICVQTILNFPISLFSWLIFPKIDNNLIE